MLVSLFSFLGCTKNTMNELHIKVPFVFSSSLDNKNVLTVGDQMLSEHVFAYHQNLSWKKGAETLFSRITPDYKSNTITISQEREIHDQTGKVFSLGELCQSIKTNFTGTLHAQYGDLVKEITCESKTIKISFTSIPNNWQSLFASPDFAITDSKLYTGPYYIQSSNNKSVHLKINANYPKDLRANSVSDVYIEAYGANDTTKLVQNLNPEKDHATFLYGHVLQKKDIDSLKGKQFNLQIYQNEWLVYVGFTKKVNMEDREKISSFLDSKRNDLKSYAELGVPAYSMAPADKSWGITESTYNSLKKKITDLKVKKKYSIATLDEWAKLPLFAKVLELLKANFEIEIKLFPRNELGKIYEEGADLFISPMGVSPDDPVGHLYFFTSFSDEYSQVLNAGHELQKVATIKDSVAFGNALKDLEIRAIKHKLLLPLFHYPSIVAESPRLQKDPSLSWDWGIQAWTYQIH